MNTESLIILNQSVLRNLIHEKKWEEWLIKYSLGNNTPIDPFIIKEELSFFDIFDNIIITLSENSYSNLINQSNNLLFHLNSNENIELNHVNKLLYLIQRIYKNKIYLGLENYLNSLHKYVPKKEQIISLELNDVENFYQIIAEWLLTYQIESRNQINNELIRAYNDVIFNSNNLFLEANTNLFIFDKLLYYNFLLKLVLYPKRWINYTIDFIIFRELIEKKIQCNHPKMEQLLRVNKYIEPAILFKLVNYLHSMNLITKEELYKDFEKNHKASSFQKIIKIFRTNFFIFQEFEMKQVIVESSEKQISIILINGEEKEFNIPKLIRLNNEIFTLNEKIVSIKIDGNAVEFNKHENVLSDLFEFIN